MKAILVETSAGELMDKITILEIKRGHIKDAGKLKNVEAELAALEATRGREIAGSPELERLVTELRGVNEMLWKIEDDIRECERAGDFGAGFVKLARAVYFENDRRARIKRAINELLGSAIVEEKSYAKYDK